MKHVLEGLAIISMPSAVNTQAVLDKYTSYFYPPITSKYDYVHDTIYKDVIDKQWSKKISNDQELIQSDPTPCPQNQKGNNEIHKSTAVYERHSR